ncbi:MULTISPECIES: LytTR family DNA-binding domain-containing protein [Roseivirga]|jgi:two-component system LytT family response regulator|uniref:DNA-binding response regulator n=1 Tax=Roseivirga thermotolerans TaxID=1758176 RepID=A0ABQ3I7M3_9BACT|nr:MULTISPECIES: LytTR family DNA-binding domain-containing protein [Roseivirga]MEC7755569.1 LytTR family DNA-binding domain-containing protein [Bacteroidota bacterium]GHE71627.1 DNA-binding response regulator [Roseivirga thermotolerans]|tara:strand:- start:2693 stop:3457 length:765 start_codon:yes stop_codon:yes gene_type:complete
MKTLIIDNEKSIREGLKQMLATYCPKVVVAGEANSVATAKEQILQNQPELMFLDVELGDGLGIDLIRSFKKLETQVIFITAHHKYAIDAFQCSALDFLLKPIDPEDLVNAVRKAEQFSLVKDLEAQLKVLEDRLNKANQLPEKIVLTDSESIYLVKVNDILWCGAEGSYTRFTLADGSEILVSKNLKAYEGILEGDRFLRIHHSYLVNIQHIKRFERSEGGLLVMDNGQILPVSVRKKDNLMQLLKTWNETLIK